MGASQIRAPIAQTPIDSDHLCRKLEEEFPSSVRRLPVFPAKLQKIPCNDDSGNFFLVKEERCFWIEQIDISDEGCLTHPVIVHVETQFMHFAGIESDLIDDEFGATFDFLLQLEVLRNYFPFEQFVVCRHRSDAEFGLLVVLIEPAVHLVQHANEPDGVDVEHGFRHSFVPRDRIVPCHGEDVMKSLTVQEPGLALESVPIEIFAREMKNDLLAGIEDRFSEGLRRELGIASGIVGDGNPVDRGILNELGGKRAGLDGVPLPHGAADRDELDSEQEA